MRHSNPSIFGASILAGPLFLLWTGLAALYQQVPNPVPIDFGIADALQAFLLCLFAAVVGLFLSLLPNFVGTTLLALLAERWEPAQSRLFWAAIGALLGIGIAYSVGVLTGPLSAFGFGLTATSAISASLCHRGCRRQ